MDERRLRRLIRNAAHGNDQAAGELFDHYHPRVFRYGLSRLRDRGAAEDVASETFARVLRGLDRFRWRGAGFEAWLFRIAGNLVTDHLRSLSKESAHPEALEFADTAELRTPEWAAIEGARTKELNNMLALLPPDQREVLVLRFAAGLETDEIGAVMGRKPNAVRQLQFRALHSLRARLPDGVDV